MAYPIKDVTYQWKGINLQGDRIQGEVTARNFAFAKAILKRQAISIIKIRKKSKAFSFTWTQKIKSRDITAFSRQTAALVLAGFPIVQALTLVSQSNNQPKMQVLISKIRYSIESGSTFFEALNKYPNYFNQVYCHLINLGEQTGSLDIMLKRLAEHNEKIETLKGKIKKALFYPITVFIIAMGLASILLVFVVPQFALLFKTFGADLPAMTRCVITISKNLQAYWWVILSAILCTSWFLMCLHKHSNAVKYQCDKLALRIPLIGPLINKAIIARFIRSLSITYQAGIPLLNALDCVAGATGNLIFAYATRQIRYSISSGQALHEAMGHSHLFPKQVIQMVSIGEESGTLESLLSKTADMHEKEVDNTMEALSSLLEPLIMLILGTLIGGLVIAMYLPIFKLGSVV